MADDPARAAGERRAVPSAPAPSGGGDRRSLRGDRLRARREELAHRLGGRFWLRWHASLIAAGTFGAGFAANAAMLAMPVHPVLVRWPLAVLAGYAAFFLLVRLWLAYVGVRPFGARGRHDFADAADAVALPVDLASSSTRAAARVPFGGGGGSSGGAGASALFDSPAAGASPASSSGGSILGDAAGKVGGAIGDSDGCLPLILAIIVLALVAGLVGGAAWLVWIAPEFLADAAFAALLSAGVLPGIRRLDEPDWGGRVLRATWVALVVALVVVLLAGAAFTHYFPGMRTLGEAWMALR